MNDYTRQLTCAGEADLMREAAYLDVTACLAGGQISAPQAVIALRQAYRQANTHQRSGRPGRPIALYCPPAPIN